MSARRDDAAPQNGGGVRFTEGQVRRELLREADRDGRRRMRKGLVAVLVLAIAVGIVAERFVATLVNVRTAAMSRTLKSGDVVLCERADFTTTLESLGGRLFDAAGDDAQTRRGRLALVRYEENGMRRETIRRIVGLPGEEISVSPDGHVLVNGEAIDEPYASWRTVEEPDEAEPGGAIENPFVEPGELPQTGEAAVETELEYPITVSPGFVFVLCDDREDLLDSRNVRFGLVKQADVLGWPRMVIWPLARLALLQDGK